MTPTPPRRARALLAWAFRHDPALPAILGDLHESFVARARARGPAAARRFYRTEALGLVLGRLAHRPFETLRSSRSMSDPSPVRALLQDARYAVRSLGRHPAFALFAAVVVALGVGSTTAVYSVLKPLMLEPLPFPDAHRLVWIGNVPPADGDASLSAVTSRTSNLADFRREARSLESLTGYNAFAPRVAHTLGGGDRPEQVTSVGVAHDFLDVLGVVPVVGRGFTAEEGAVDGPPAVILSHGWWVRRFDADPAVVGRPLVIDGAPRTVVGVLPAWFDFSSFFSPTVGIDYLEPFPIAPETDRQGNTTLMIGRLRAGVSAGAAQEELDAIVDALQEAQPDRWGLAARVEPLQDHLAAPFRPALLLLAAAAGAVLLIVVVNLSNLLLARAPGRRREVAVRRAMGAPRGRIARQLLLESVLIAAAGSVLGAVLAVGVTVALRGSAAVQVPLLERVGVDGGAMAFCALVALATGLLVGLVPALQVADGDEARALRDASRGSSGSRSARRVREGLVVAEVGLACGILVVGGLLFRSFLAVLEVDLGFDADDAVAWQVRPSHGFESARAMADHYASIADRVEALPTVREAGFIDALPLGRNRSWSFRRPDEPEEGAFRSMYPHMAEAGYFEAMGIGLVDGRLLTRDDGPESARVVLLNESGARSTFPEGDAVGRTIRFSGEEWEVVGVVEDVRHLSPETPSGTQVYFSYAQVWSFGSMDLVVRAGAPVDEVRGQVAAVLSEVDPGMPVDETYTLRSRVDGAVSSRSFVLRILSGFGMVALLLAGLGIYGVLAQSVAERRQEIGIRMALGASASLVVGGLVKRTVLLAFLGILLGAGLALAGRRLVASLLFGVAPVDPVAFAGTAVLLLAVAAVAGAAPAFRAARVRGVGALRSG